MSFYLLDNLNPNGLHYYIDRKKEVQGIVIHMSESYGASDLARIYSKIARPSSMHALVDEKEIIELLPPTYTAFHTTNFNSNTIGVEIVYKSEDWGKRPLKEDLIITNLAEYCAKLVKAYNIPLRLCTKNEFEAGLKGFVLHNALTENIYDDPGKNFETLKLFKFIKEVNTK